MSRLEDVRKELWGLIGILPDELYDPEDAWGRIQAATMILHNHQHTTTDRVTPETNEKMWAIYGKAVAKMPPRKN